VPILEGDEHEPELLNALRSWKFVEIPSTSRMETVDVIPPETNPTKEKLATAKDNHLEDSKEDSSSEATLEEGLGKVGMKDWEIWRGFCP